MACPLFHEGELWQCWGRRRREGRQSVQMAVPHGLGQPGLFENSDRSLLPGTIWELSGLGLGVGAMEAVFLSSVWLCADFASGCFRVVIIMKSFDLIYLLCCFEAWLVMAPGTARRLRLLFQGKTAMEFKREHEDDALAARRAIAVAATWTSRRHWPRSSIYVFPLVEKMIMGLWIPGRRTPGMDRRSFVASSPP